MAALEQLRRRTIEVAGGTLPFLEQEMRSERTLWAIGIALVAIASVATAAPQHGAGQAAGLAAGQAPAAGGVAASGARAADPLFAILDTDGDGVISAKELHKAVAAIKECDANHDGSISWDEIVAASAAVNQMRLGNDSTGVAAGGGIGGENTQAMGRFMQYDKNHDGKVTVDEVPASMRDWDQNHDGVIDAREVEFAVRKMGDRADAILGHGLGGPLRPGTAGHMPGSNPAGGAKTP
jgi:Ca2+-binding EF-hand superfamily protein